MLNKLMKQSISNRLLVVMASFFILALGVYLLPRVPVDIFPDLTAPTVTILTEGPGKAPEAMERQITFPIETAMNGAPNVRRVRSASSLGLSIVWVEFDWGTDIYQARQVVSEKLQTVKENLPTNIHPPTMAPISSIMGEIMLVSLTYKDLEGLSKDEKKQKMLELRSLADWNIRRRLLALSGVSQVVPIGGGVKEYQVHVWPEKMKEYNVSLDEIERALEETNENFTGGIYHEKGREIVIRGEGRIGSIQDLEQAVVTYRDGVSITIEDLARVQFGPALKRGDGSVNGREAVIMSIQKQPNANTLELTAKLDKILAQIQKSNPQIEINGNIFRQADFIQVGIRNVQNALLEGAVLVILILIPFMGSFRVTLITAVTIPFSLILATLAMFWFGFSINTMTLGGMAIAIGMLVDDAIVFIENIVRRLRLNQDRPPEEKESASIVIFKAAREVLNSVLFATLIIVVVFLPLFFLYGVEGRMFQPLGFAFIFALSASLLVALTVTPAMASFLLSGADFLKSEKEPWLMATMKKAYHPLLEFCLKFPRLVIGASVILILIGLLLFPFLGKAFLPEFNEGSMTVTVQTLPGTSLEKSNELGRMTEKILLSHDEVLTTTRRTGRSEMDEHAEGVHFSEIDVRIDLSEGTKEELSREIRANLAAVPGVVINLGQPISHRIDHILSGTEAAVAVKLFGNNLEKLREKALAIQGAMENIDGVVDLFVEQQINIPETKVIVNRERAADYGMKVGEIARQVEVLLGGKVISRVIEGEKSHDLRLRLEPEARGSIQKVRECLIDTPSGDKIPLSHVTKVRREKGPNRISRENVKRKIVVQCNISGRDLGSVISDIKAQVKDLNIEGDGYYVVYGGQFESQKRASRLITFLSLLALVCIFLLLDMALDSMRAALLVMANLPLALIGGVLAIFLSDGILSIASMIGFITLFGIATRNGIILVSHYDYLMTEENKSFREALYQGSMERLAPVLMTALTTGLGLFPLVLAGSKAGNEIQSPMALVILGGLITSTFLNMAVIPALFSKFGRPKGEATSHSQ